jgi:phosphate transport system substrate-binding protein
LSRAVRSGMLVGALLLTLALVLSGCGGGGEEKKEEETKKEDTGKDKEKTEKGGGGGSPGQIAVEGSSTVLPITQAAAEGFNRQNPDVQITVGGSGTGDGFEAFCSGDTQIADASRPIRDEEAQTCEENGVEFIELAVAQDGITVVVNPQNDFANDITLEQLGTLWGPDAEGQVDSWNDVNPDWPDQPINLYGPGTESGTFEFFTEKANGKAKESRTDYQASEDDNVLVQGVSGDPNALGYFGFGYFEQNQQQLKALSVNGIQPSVETIQSNEYPLARPLFIYVSTQALDENQSVEEFVSYYLENLDQFVQQALYVPLGGPSAQETRQRFEDRVAGSDPQSATAGESKEQNQKEKEEKQKKEDTKKEDTEKK